MWGKGLRWNCWPPARWFTSLDVASKTWPTSRLPPHPSPLPEEREKEGASPSSAITATTTKFARPAFGRIADEQARLDILVNNVWGGYENMMENGQFTWTRPFWKQPLARWDAMFAAGRSGRLRRQPISGAADATPTVRPDREHFVLGGEKHIGNVAYGVSKAATDKLTADMAHGSAMRTLPSSRSTPDWCGRKK